MSNSKKDEFEEILKHVENTGIISRKEFISKVLGKIKEVGGLIDKVAAAMIVAKELGIKIPVRSSKTFQLEHLRIKDIVDGLTKIGLIGRIIDIDPPIKLYKSNKEVILGKIFLADETGSIRLTLWPPHTKLIENLKMGINDLVKITNARSKSFRGRIELNLDERGSLKILKGSEFKLPIFKEIIGRDFIEVRDILVTNVCSPINLETRWGKRKVGCIEGLKDNIFYRFVLWNKRSEWTKFVKIGDILDIKGLFKLNKDYSISKMTFKEFSCGKNISLTKKDHEELMRKTLTPENIAISSYTVNCSGYVVGLLPGRGNTIRLLVLQGNKIVDTLIRHPDIKRDILSKPVEILYKKIIIKNVEPASYTKHFTLLTNLWSSFSPENEHLLLKDLLTVSSLKNEIRIRSVNIGFYCKYCYNKINSITHECFSNREIKISTLFSITFSLKLGNERIIGIVSHPDFLEKIAKVSINEIEDSFTEEEDITAVIKYILEEKVKRGLQLTGKLLNFSLSDDRIFIVFDYTIL